MNIQTLHTERAYLLATFHQQQRSSADFLAKIPPLEEKLNQDHPPAIRRRVRKQINWFKHRLDEVTAQESAILARLGQITQEITERERGARMGRENWNTANYHQPGGYVQFPEPIWSNGYHEQEFHPSPMSPALYTEHNHYPEQLHIPSPIEPGYFPPQSLPLSPLSPNFIPSGIFTPTSPFLTVPWQQQQWPAQNHNNGPSHWQPHHQDSNRYLSLGNELQRPGSSRDISPTRRLSQVSRNDETDQELNSAANSLSISTDTYQDPDSSEALDTVPCIIPPRPHLAPAVLVQRPASMDYAALQNREEGEAVVANSAGSPVFKRLSVPNTGAVSARRKSLPVLFGMSPIWALTKEEEGSGKTVGSVVEEEEEEEEGEEKVNGDIGKGVEIEKGNEEKA